LCYIHGEELAIAQSSRELRWLADKVLAGCDLVVANSRHTQELLLNDWKLPPERVRLLHPGVDTSRFQPAPPSQDVRTRLGWGDRPVVLTVGRLQARKGHDCLIRSLQAVKQRVPNVLYAIVGDGEQRAELDALVTSEGLADHVVFHGELRDEDLIDCYQQCDLFALPNRQVGKDFEGFGMVLLEAQACGRPVIAGTSGGTAETMSIPATGRLVCCDAPQPLADALIDLLRDSERLNQMGQAARRWVVENFDWDSLSLRAMEIFASVEATDVAFATAPSESTAKSKVADDAVAGISA
jgi:phosphatidylinositol alpha-1,6-mannosyltransferase